jgi:Txe/YoeB family toxin of Txe-Axe toxin-antitoxin module
MVKKVLENKSIELSARLKAIAKKNNESLENITKIFEEKKVELSKQGVTVNLERIAVNAVMNDYRKIKVRQTNGFSKRKEAVFIEGFVTGDRGIWDKAENIRRAAKKYIDKNGLQAAVEAQLVDGDGNILDTREKVYGKDNPKYLEPLPPEIHIMERTLYGFFKRKNTKIFKYGSIQTNDNRLAKGWSKVKFSVPCEVYALLKEETDDDIKLSSSSAEDTLSIFKASKTDIDIKTVIDSTLSGKWTEISKVEEFHEKFKDVWDRRIFVKGVVAWLGIDRPTAIGSIRMGLMNPDNEDEIVIVEIPEQIPIDFGELSEIYVFGTTRRQKYYNEEKELVDGDVTITATGIFPTIPTPRDSGYSGRKVDDSPVEGWIDG